MVEYVNALLALYVSDEAEGQGLVEYALIIALIAILLVAALTGVRTALIDIFTRISTAIGAAK